MNYLNILSQPDRVIAQREHDWLPLEKKGDLWVKDDISVRFDVSETENVVQVTAGDLPLSRILCYWNQEAGECKILNDHWERGYGDLEWTGNRGERVLPWYFMTSDGTTTHGYGVKTGPGSMCSWLMDTYCVRLVLDVRNGGEGVYLGGRTLDAAHIVTRQGAEGEDPFDATHDFCKIMCEKPVLPKFPIYGGNNWYYAYGKCSHDSIVEDSRGMSELAGDAEVRPFMVIDAGWHSNIDVWYKTEDDPWMDGCDNFPDMAATAAAMKAEGVHPGLWFRPLQTSNKVPKEWLLKTNRKIGLDTNGLVLDPSIPEVLDEIAKYMKRFWDWGYELVKHDFTSYDILGRYGYRCGLNLTESGWHFADRSKTTAEIVLDLFRAIKRGAPEMLIIGCNTFSHLSAGIFEMQRTGDDTSGRQWERTRKMGVNTLAFRMPQHNTFYAADADCVGLTENIAWSLNEAWIDVLGNSGTVVLISADPKVLGPEQKEAIKKVFKVASKPHPVSRPLDWMSNATPAVWKESDGTIKTYNWTDMDMLQSLEGEMYEEI